MSRKTLRRAAALLSTAALAAGATPVLAQEVEEPEFVVERNYFECDGPTKVGNANLVLTQALPGWSTTAPTGSVQGGEGCGSAELAALAGTSQRTIYDASWEGTFTGNIADILMDLHFIQPATAAYGDIALDLRVTIDGRSYDLGTQFIDGAPTTQSASGASYSMQFGINDIDIIDDPKGPGTVTHTYTITAEGHFIDTGFAVPFVWGTTEVPAGLTFNGDTTGLPAVRL